MGLGAWVLGLRWVLGLGSWKMGLGSWVWGPGRWVLGLGSGVSDGSGVWGLGSRKMGLGSGVWGPVRWVLGLGSGVSDGSWVLGLGSDGLAAIAIGIIHATPEWPSCIPTFSRHDFAHGFPANRALGSALGNDLRIALFKSGLAQAFRESPCLAEFRGDMLHYLGYSPR